MVVPSSRPKPGKSLAETHPELAAQAATSPDQRTHAVELYDQREARHRWFMKPNTLFPAYRATLLNSRKKSTKSLNSISFRNFDMFSMPTVIPPSVPVPPEVLPR